MGAHIFAEHSAYLPTPACWPCLIVSSASFRQPRSATLSCRGQLVLSFIRGDLAVNPGDRNLNNSTNFGDSNTAATDRWLRDRDLVVIDTRSDQSDHLSTIARQLVLELPQPQQDDRYLDRLPDDSLAAAIAVSSSGEPTPVAFAHGTQSRGRLQVDLLTSTAHGDDYADSGSDSSADAIGKILLDRIHSLPSTANGTVEPTIELWTRPDSDRSAATPTSLGFHRHRSLYQLRAALHESRDAVMTRPFDPDRDLENLVNVNNRSFANHPDQGRQSADSISAVLNQSWFRRDGLRVLDDPDGSGAMAGFCWTKVHPAGHYHPTIGADSNDIEAALGEIFVIGLDPDFHGRRLGTPLVAAGLNWLAAQGLSEALLYVEADNHPALRTYDRLGFIQNRVDTAWRQ